ncbi:AAA family ATPase [Mesorhizobium sp. M0129]|uniref:tyrosine-protein kinase family protein n=1 Tax=Mesorhizobium sp. M0129 TaxID=2956886 RepID=UPI00333C9CE9
MFVVTFYSYKGGVGRTMALVNTAVALTRLGRRVLVVDFDLEAPGLPSYQTFQSAECERGLVDYVNAYRATGVAPNASEFIAPCDVEGMKIWLMPAGRHTQRGYTEALNAIDWHRLYEEQDGYLMFEDLKQQWSRYDGHGFDYVLIDSRTGHTDVGGICTRQLPDAVVVMFLPNDQNIAGLAPIVAGIRAENKSRVSKIKLQFCPSNVPNLDDEKEILKNLLNEASEKLKYQIDDSRVIHHYSSLELLAQPAFVISRPNSLLAKEYEGLRISIVALNFSDPEGAIAVLQRMPERLERARNLRSDSVRYDLRSQAIEIRTLHPQNGEIAYLTARVFSEIGDQEEELVSASAAIELGHEINRSRLGRALLHSVANRREEAISDLKEVLVSPTATIFELGPALQFLFRIEDDWTDSVAIALDRPDTEFRTVLALSTFVMTVRSGLAALGRRVERSISSPALDETQRRLALNTSILCFIGSGQFRKAIELIDAHADKKARSAVDQFNFAMAQWGETGRPSKESFKNFVEQFSRPDAPRNANEQQCLALALGVLGHLDLARAELQAARNRLNSGEIVFSCWRYLNVTGDEMKQDIDDMDAILDRDQPLKPPFFEDAPKRLH